MRRILISTLAALLLLPATAAAKEITKVTVCGVDRCETSRDPVLLQGLMQGGPPTTPPERGGVVRVRATVAEPDGTVITHFNSHWVQERGVLVAEDGTWMQMPDDFAVVMDKIGSTVELLPADEVFPAPAPAPAQAPAPADDSSFPWWLGAVPVVIAVGLAIVRRRRPGHGDAPQTA